MTFKPPTMQQAKEYANSIGYKTFNEAKWWHWYNSKGWKVGRGKGTKMTSWKSAVWTWFTDTYEWRESQRKKNENKQYRKQHREQWSDYFDTAAEIKLIELRKTLEWEYLWWLIDELRPEIKDK